MLPRWAPSRRVLPRLSFRQLPGCAFFSLPRHSLFWATKPPLFRTIARIREYSTDNSRASATGVQWTCPNCKAENSSLLHKHQCATCLELRPGQDTESKWICACSTINEKTKTPSLPCQWCGAPHLSAVINVERLHYELTSADQLPGRIVVLDASWYMPTHQHAGRARELHAQKRIPGSAFIDIDSVSDPDSPFPHMLPSARDFAQHMRDLGVRNSDRLVVYDQVGLFSSPRVWHMLRYFGHKAVRVLDGGLPAWEAAGLPLAREDTAPTLPPCGSAASLSEGADKSDHNETDLYPILPVKNDLVQSLEQMRGFVRLNVLQKQVVTQIVDARSEERFQGDAPDPRPGVRPGHMPYALNVPFGRVIGADQCLLEPQELRKVFDDAGVDMSRLDTVVTSCGSGVTASVLALALNEIGAHSTSVYDGSWSEWGHEQTPPLFDSWDGSAPKPIQGK